MKHIKNNEEFFKRFGTGTDEESLALAEGFCKMPRQAQGLILSNIFWINPDSESMIRDVIMGCDSPIEYVYGIALSIAIGVRHDDLWEDHNNDRGILIYLYPQLEIETDSKCYRADFILSVAYLSDEIPDSEMEQDIAIECDGFKYHHSNKEQVQHDNERELAIKKAGYEVLRFSGSQIYNDPFKCANDTIDYIISEMSRRCVAEGTNG